jgi:hypothetical protein
VSETSRREEGRSGRAKRSQPYGCVGEQPETTLRSVPDGVSNEGVILPNLERSCSNGGLSADAERALDSFVFNNARVENLSNEIKCSLTNRILKERAGQNLAMAVGTI